MPGFNITIPNVCHDGDAHNWDGESAFQGPIHTVETARKHRYRLEILEPFAGESGDNNGILLFCEKCTRPTPEIDEIIIHNGQDEIYRPGKQRWNPIEFTFYEKLRGNTDETAELIYKWWGKIMLALTDSTQRPVSEYYKRGHLQMLNGVGNPIWTYFLYDCWITKVSPSDLAYSDSDIATISVTLRFNKAEEREI